MYSVVFRDGVGRCPYCNSLLLTKPLIITPTTTRIGTVPVRGRKKKAETDWWVGIIGFFVFVILVYFYGLG